MLLKQSITAILLLALIGQVFNRAVIVTGYYANTSAYAKNCENKAKPQMHCNGKCQMMKKLKQEENRDKQNSERRSFQDETLSSRSFFAVIVPALISDAHLHCGFYHSYFPSEHSDSIFHPPGIIA